VAFPIDYGNKSDLVLLHETFAPFHVFSIASVRYKLLDCCGLGIQAMGDDRTAEYLQSEGYLVTTAQTAQEGLQLFAVSPDVRRGNSQAALL
jgi:hypothetical protein